MKSNLMTHFAYIFFNKNVNIVVHRHILSRYILQKIMVSKFLNSRKIITLKKWKNHVHQLNSRVSREISQFNMQWETHASLITADK